MVLTLALALAAFTAVLLANGATTYAQQSNASKTDDLALRINRARIQAGARPVARSPELDGAAQAHSLDMVQHNYLDHTAPDGSEPRDRAQRAGYRVPPDSGWIVIEVISAISGDPQGPLDWWLNEDPAVHGKAVLNPRWREVGIGYAEGGEYGHYWTAMFGCRPGVLPSIAVDGTTYATKEECGDPGQVVTVQPTAMPATAAATATPVPSAAAPAVSLTSEVATPGGMLNVRWNGIEAPRPTDWLGLYRRSDIDMAPLTWVYVGCAATPLDARAIGSCNMLIPNSVAAGAYEFRLFAANRYDRLATSPPVTIHTD